MKLKIIPLKFLAGRPVAMLHKATAIALGVHVDERVKLNSDGKEVIAVVDITQNLLKPFEIAISKELADLLRVGRHGNVEVYPAVKPISTSFISKKLDGKKLSKHEIKAIIKDIVNNALTEAEIAYFISAVYTRGMSMQETFALIESIVETGKKLKLRGLVADKHSIGGIAGNRTTPIVVSICASAGLTMPKTSSRAITSAAGTADVIETIARVDFDAEELQEIVRHVGACLAWGGALGLAPADDKIIQVERLLNLDPEPQLLASIMAKKIAVGSKYVIIDLPYGIGAKVSYRKAKHLSKKFYAIAKHFGIRLRCLLTRGNEPIGNGIGPLLEIRDVIAVLKQDENRPYDLERKALYLASQLLELTGKASRGRGMELASFLLKSGKALKKFEEIIEAQHGSLEKAYKMKPARYRKEIIATHDSIVKEINNKKINMLARLAGCPADKTAGVYLHKHVGERVKKGEKIITIFAENKIRLKEAVEYYHTANPIILSAL